MYVCISTIEIWNLFKCSMIDITRKFRVQLFALLPELEENSNNLISHVLINSFIDFGAHRSISKQSGKCT